MSCFLLSFQTLTSSLLPLALSWSPGLTIYLEYRSSWSVKNSLPFLPPNPHSSLALRSIFFFFPVTMMEMSFLLEKANPYTGALNPIPCCLVKDFSSFFIFFSSSINNPFFMNVLIPSLLICSRIFDIEKKKILSLLDFLPNSYCTIYFLSSSNFSKICLNVRSLFLTSQSSLNPFWCNSYL